MPEYRIQVQRIEDGAVGQVVFTVPEDGDPWQDGELSHEGSEEVREDVQEAIRRYQEDGEPWSQAPDSGKTSDWRLVVWVAVNMGLGADARYVVDVLSAPPDPPGPQTGLGVPRKVY